MKIQRLSINNKIAHVIDYDINDNHIEKFIINKPVGSSLSLVKLDKDSTGAYIIDTEQSKSLYYISGISIDKVEANNSLHIYNIEITFVQSVDAKQDASANANNAQHSADPFDYKRNKKAKQSESKPVPQFEINNNIGNELILSVNDSDNGILNIQYNDSIVLNGDSIQFNLQFNLDSSDAFGTTRKSRYIRVFFANRDNICDAILDYGSEATQLAIFSRDREATIEGFNALFPNIKACCVTNEEMNIANENFYQYDNSDEHFYRSYFLVKKNINRGDIDAIVSDIMSDTGGNFFKVLTSKEFVQNNSSNYIVAPNIKLSSFGGVELPRVMVDDVPTSIADVAGMNSHLIQRLGMAPFLHQAIKNAIAMNPVCKFISFHFLMPNVYMQHRVSTLLKVLQRDIEEIIIQNEVYGQIVGVEVTAVSESDASIIGACELHRNDNANNQLPEGRYLLLDAGKGTLDLSLIDYRFNGTGYSYKNLWRSGIIGAGNALSYAYLWALLHQYLDESLNLGAEIDEDVVARYISEKILGQDEMGVTDPALLLQLMRNVDAFKIHSGNYQYYEHDTTDRLNSIDALELGGFISWIADRVDEDKNAVTIRLRYQGYIDRMIDSIINETLNGLNDMECIAQNQESIVDYVVFSGRSFSYQDFKNRMLSAVTMKFPNVTEQSFLNENVAVSMKNICLLCSRPLINGEYERVINSRVCIIDERPVVTQTKSEKPKSRGILGRWNLRGMFASENVSTNSSFEKAYTISIAGGRKIEQKFATMLELDEPSYSVNKVAREDKSSGYNIRVNNLQYALLNIGGVSISLTGLGVQQGMPIDVLFNGERHYVRSNGTCVDVAGPAINMRRSPFLIASFFPNFIIGNINRNVLHIPKVECNWQDDKLHNQLEQPSGISDNGGQKAKDDSTSKNGVGEKTQLDDLL